MAASIEMPLPEVDGSHSTPGVPAQLARTGPPGLATGWLISTNSSAMRPSESLVDPVK